MCLIVLSKIMHSPNRVDKFVMFNYETRKIELRTPSDLSSLIDAGHNIIGLRKGGVISVTPMAYFRNIAKIGEENLGGGTESKADESYTIVCQRLSKNNREYEVSDRIGNLEIWSREELNEKIKEHHHVNGAKIINNKLMICQSIPSIILQ